MPCNKASSLRVLNSCDFNIGKLVDLERVDLINKPHVITQCPLPVQTERIFREHKF